MPNRYCVDEVNLNLKLQPQKQPACNAKDELAREYHHYSFSVSKSDYLKWRVYYVIDQPQELGAEGKDLASY